MQVLFGGRAVFWAEQGPCVGVWVELAVVTPETGTPLACRACESCPLLTAVWIAFWACCALPEALLISTWTWVPELDCRGNEEEVQSQAMTRGRVM